MLGLAIGKDIISKDTTYAILLVMQVLLLLIGLASFSSSPGFWEPELDEPTPEDESRRLEEKAAAVGVRAQLSALLLDIAAPFRRPVFQWLFVYCKSSTLALPGLVKRRETLLKALSG